MKVTMGCKFNIGKTYEMTDFSVELTDQDFPEVASMDFAKKSKYLQGQAILQNLMFKVASGYIQQNSDEYLQQHKIACQLINSNK